MDHSAERGFMLGIRVAEHVHRVRSRFGGGALYRMLETLGSIARGDLTLIDTPEGVAAEYHTPNSVRARLPEILRDSREKEREIAKEILQSMFGDASQP